MFFQRAQRIATHTVAGITLKLEHCSRNVWNSEKKIMTEKSAREQEQYPIYDHLNELIPTTFCENKENNIDCTNRECDDCGVHVLRLHPEVCDASATARQVTWTKYEYVKVHIKNSKDIKKLVKKTTAPGQMFSYFRHLLLSFPAHQFRANWQTNQMKTLLEHLPLNDCICVHDFSDKISCIEKNDLQSSYFQKVEVSIHVTVIHSHSLLEYDGVDSTEDMPNIVTDHFFVQHFTQGLVSEYLNSITYPTETMHEFTDGCQSQYKSRHCMGTVAHACEDLGYNTLIPNYFETSHGKGPQDAAGGCFKWQAEMAVMADYTVCQRLVRLWKEEIGAIKRSSYL